MAQVKVTLTAADINRLNEGRKRKINIGGSADAQRKFLKNCGLPYTGRNGASHDDLAKLVSEKVCNDKCQKQGCLLSLEEKKAMNNDFWRVGDKNYNRQSNILLSLMEWSVPVKRTTDIEISRRGASYYYNLINQYGIKMPCCAASFMNVFSISKQRLETIQKKKRAGVLTIEDQRGCHKNRPRRHSEENIALIKGHIQSFPTYLSHYSRANGNPERLYLQEDLNPSKMFRLFVEKYGNYFLDFEHLYKDLLRQTQLRFGMPKTDTCNVCDKQHSRLCNCDPNNRQRIQEIESQLENHHSEAQGGYDEMKRNVQRAKIDPTFVVIATDLQKQLLSPRLTSQEMYYLRKFVSYNLGITSPATDESTMYFWNENDGNRGQNDIGSCILKYIVEKYEKLNPGETRILNIWSDRCMGQNNNYSTVCLLKYLLHIGYFTEVNQKFLVSGHSFLSCDRHFAAIERYQKTCTIFTPDDWIETIRSSRLVKPFEVVQMKFADFRNIAYLKELIPKPTTLKVSQYHWIQMTADAPNIIRTKQTHNPNNDWELHTILNPCDGHTRIHNRIPWEPNGVVNVAIPNAYDGLMPISEAKKGDIQKMIDYLPNSKKEFFAALLI